MAHELTPPTGVLAEREDLGHAIVVLGQLGEEIRREGVLLAGHDRHQRTGSLLGMAQWAEFEKAEPKMAARVRRLMSTRKHLTMATLRRDGSPRISGTEVQFGDGELRIGSMSGSVKAMDLRRDPRVAIHGPTHDPAKSGAWRGEAKVAGRAVEGPHDSFRIDVHEVVITRLNAGRNGLAIESWTPGRGYRLTERA